MSSSSVPPRFVPTLTEIVVLPEQAISSFPDESSMLLGAPNSIASPVSMDSSNSSTEESFPGSEFQNAYLLEREEQLVRRVLQRVDVILEERLAEAIGRIVSEQTQTLSLRLQEEIEYVVRDSVSLAFEQESHAPR